MKKEDESPDQLMTDDLEELIKANGEDIEFEFHANGNEVAQSFTLFEIHK